MKEYVADSTDQRGVRVRTTSDGSGPYLVTHRPGAVLSGGFGPAQLARDILWDYLDEEPPAWLYQQYSEEVTSKLDTWGKGWTITGEQIEEWLDVKADPSRDPWGKGRAFLDGRSTDGHEPSALVLVVGSDDPGCTASNMLGRCGRPRGHGGPHHYPPVRVGPR